MSAPIGGEEVAEVEVLLTRLDRARRAKDKAHKALRHAEREERLAVDDFNDQMTLNVLLPLTRVYEDGKEMAAKLAVEVRKVIGNTPPRRRGQQKYEDDSATSSR